MRIADHCFVPQAEDQLIDKCAYTDCGKPEIDHEWTVEAYRANPEVNEVALLVAKCGYCKNAKSGMLIYRERYICPDCVLPKLARLDELEPFTIEAHGNGEKL
jgi:hypothetical protein